MKTTIYTELKNRILYTEYAPGQILNEQSLAGEFGVSRTPLRAVLMKLEWEQLVRILPRTGIQVTELELNTIMNVFQARLELEEVIGRLASQRLDQTVLSRFEHMGRDLDALKGNKDPRALAAMDQAIKEIFNQAAANPFLMDISSRLYALTFRLWYFNLVRVGQAEWDDEVSALGEELAELSGLMVRGDLQAVGQMRKDRLLRHLQRIRTIFLGLTGLP